jgi:ADP-heptose:LPS heptosyltransferase
MRLLVIRTSAMGDVALTAHVIAGMRKQYPDVEIVMLTRPAYRAFFSSISGLRYFFPDLNKTHKGLSGILRLYRDINKMFKIDLVIDLHDVLRSKILRSLFRLSGVPVFVIEKGRDEKRAVINGKKKVKLKHSVERYIDTFARAGFTVAAPGATWFVPSHEALQKIDLLIDPQIRLNIGVAPYAKHKLKMWPEVNMLRLLELISVNHKCAFWLFGGTEDSEKLAAFQVKLPGSFNLVGRLDLEEELALMTRLDFMIAMDSSNMHMAALAGTKVVSIWGGTDPLSGFGAWMQPDNFSIRIPVDELTCRPCTTFGKGECKRGDFACMNWLTPETVYKRIEKLVLNY